MIHRLCQMALGGLLGLALLGSGCSSSQPSAGSDAREPGSTAVESASQSEGNSPPTAVRAGGGNAQPGAQPAGTAGTLPATGAGPGTIQPPPSRGGGDSAASARNPGRLGGASIEAPPPPSETQVVKNPDGSVTETLPDGRKVDTKIGPDGQIQSVVQ